MQIGAMNLMVSESNTGGLVLSEVPQKISVYYFYNNFFFLGATIVYLIQAIWFEDYSTDLLDCTSRWWCGEFWINFWGSFLYFMSSFFSVMEYFEYTRLRAEDGLPALKFFPSHLRELDWFGWGDCLFLATSVVAMGQVFVTSFWDDSDDVYNALYLLENCLFLVDSLMYFIGYILYMLELQSAMATGMVDAQVAQSCGAYFGWDENGVTTSSTHPRSRHSFAMDSNGKVRMDDIRSALKDARTHRIARKLEEENHRKSLSEISDVSKRASAVELMRSSC
eukprot:gene26088-32618_t